jgi:hypothetical protein
MLTDPYSDASIGRGRWLNFGTDRARIFNGAMVPEPQHLPNLGRPDYSENAAAEGAGRCGSEGGQAGSVKIC